MLRRSQRQSSKANHQGIHTPAHSKNQYKSTSAKGKLRLKYLKASEDDQKVAAKEDFEAKHKYPVRPEQTTAVVDLLNGRTTILLAGTGFGKSRVPEMFYHAHEDKYAPIILSINPLDSLGDDQVSEKAAVNLRAVNLTGANCTPQKCEDILQGKYNFVYVSPEIALTSDVFDRMWRNPSFQARLVLMVVDEAHMVYEWGLVASGEAKRLASLTRVQDAGVFRPSYGDLSRRILSAGKIPLLLMSATCTPQQLLAISANLKLDSSDVRIIRAELTRPELRLIRRSFKRPLKASLRGIFAHHTVVPNASLPPSLVYCGTQNATLEFLLLLCMARGLLKEAANGHSNFARRYHATTGPKAKLDAVATYVAGTLAVLCCTLALGLGQNWHRVRRVVIVGRQSPGSFIQMSGQCGRDGRRGLGILLVESKRTRGKNKIEDFKTPMLMTDDDRMDALAITPVCLRIALAVDLQYGYIPLRPGSYEVQAEAERQLSKKMRKCDCSNCLPEEAEALWVAQRALTQENFDDAMQMDKHALEQLIKDLPDPPPAPPTAPRLFALLCGADDPIESSPVLQRLVTRLDMAFSEFFLERFTRPSALGPKDYFGRDLAWDVAKNIDILRQPSDLEVVLVSETIPGQFHCLFDAFLRWKDDEQTATLMKEAAERRKAATRSRKAPAIPQSVEGAQLAKERKAAAKQADAAAKQAIELTKEAAENEQLASDLTAAEEHDKQDKAAEEASEKLAVEEQEKQAKAAADSTRRTQVAPKQGGPKDLHTQNTLKRPAVAQLGDVSPKRIAIAEVSDISELR